MHGVAIKGEGRRLVLANTTYQKDGGEKERGEGPSQKCKPDSIQISHGQTGDTRPAAMMVPAFGTHLPCCVVRRSRSGVKWFSLANNWDYR